MLVTEIGEEYQSVCFEFMWLVTERVTRSILFAVSSYDGNRGLKGPLSISLLAVSSCGGNRDGRRVPICLLSVYVVGNREGNKDLFLCRQFMWLVTERVTRTFSLLSVHVDGNRESEKGHSLCVSSCGGNRMTRTISFAVSLCGCT